MKIILNPKYEHLRHYLEHLEEHFDREGKEIFRDRNVIRTLKTDGLTLCVKRYAKPSLGSRLATQLYRTPKGKKAYYKPLKLRERGFSSPEPVAFVKYRKGLVTTKTYFVSLLSDYSHDLSAIVTLDDGERQEATRAFAQFAARLHEEGFLHRDFSSGNILFDCRGGRFRFTLLDTNSLRTGRPVNLEKGCANFARLKGDEEFFALLADAYAEARGADAARCRQLIAGARGKNA